VEVGSPADGSIHLRASELRLRRSLGEEVFLDPDQVRAGVYEGDKGAVKT